MFVFLLLKRGVTEDEGAIFFSCLTQELDKDQQPGQRTRRVIAKCCALHISQCDQLQLFENECPAALGPNATTDQGDIVPQLCEIFCANLQTPYPWCPVANTANFLDSALQQTTKTPNSAFLKTTETPNSAFLKTTELEDSRGSEEQLRSKARLSAPEIAGIVVTAIVVAAVIIGVAVRQIIAQE
jgi:hypothetical protein